MAAKKRIAPPRPDPNRPWHELTKAEQNAVYSAALQAYARGEGANPQTRGMFIRQRNSDKATASAN